jgi:hypothetical protein
MRHVTHLAPAVGNNESLSGRPREMSNSLKQCTVVFIRALRGGTSRHLYQIILTGSLLTIQTQWLVTCTTYLNIKRISILPTQCFRFVFRGLQLFKMKLSLANDRIVTD